MVKVIYFDYHGVLDRTDYHGLIQTIANNITRLDSSIVVRELEDFTYAYATGNLPPHQFWSTIAQRYGQAADLAARQYALHVQPIREVWNILSAAHEHFELGLFTDCAVDQKEVIRSAYGLTDYFDYLIFSCDVGSSKRVPDFYQLMLQNGKFKPSECALIDHDTTATEIAAGLGFLSHIYVDVPSLETFIQSLNAHLGDFTG